MKPGDSVQGWFTNSRRIFAPFRAAAFSPCLPKPIPDRLEASDSVRSVSSPPVNVDDSVPVTGRISIPRTCDGRTSLPRSRHDKMERLSLALPRKMRPTSMLAHPIENRKKAVTKGNSPTWCERTEAPSLRRCGFEWDVGGALEITYKHCMTPRAPRPKSFPRTGKKRSKIAAGQPIRS